MATHDYDIANQSGANFRTDLNNVLDAIVSNNSNSSDPSTTFAYMWWVDTSNNVLKLRNSANNAWITLPMSITASNTITPTLNMGTGAEEDVKIVYDGNAKDFYIALDDSADVLIIGEGSTVGTNAILTITDDSLTIGDGSAVDTKVVFNGNAQDYYIGLDDSADDLIIGRGSVVGTTPNIQINESNEIHFSPADSDVKLYIGSEGGAFGGNSSNNIRANGNDFVFNSADDFMYESGGSEVMRLLNDGNLLLGATSATASEVRIDVQYSANPVIQVKDTTNSIATWMQSTDSVAAIVAPQNYPLVFNVGASQAERARIQHNGSFAIGTTSIHNTTKLTVRQPDNDDPIARFDMAAAVNAIRGVEIRVTDGTANAANKFFLQGDDNGNTRVELRTNGDIFRSGSTTSSDLRLKENIENTEPKLDKINQVRIVDFDWKPEANKQSNRQRGVIAQELETIFPELVTQPNEYKEAYYERFIPILIKSIQELSEKFERLENGN